MRCNQLGLRSRQGRLDRVSAYAATLPADAWMLGGDWAMEALPGGVPKAISLDAVCGRPAFLPSQAHHSTWSTRWRSQANTGFSVMVPLFRNQAARRLSVPAPYKLKC
jgi:predicted amidohydrolase YtcJ